MYVLAIEASSSSGKAMVIDNTGKVLSKVSQSYPNENDSQGRLYAPRVLEIMLSCGARAVKEAQKDAKKQAQKESRSHSKIEITAIGLSSIWHSLQLVGSDMQPIDECYTWVNTESAPVVEEHKHAHLPEYQRTGCVPHTMYPRWQWEYLTGQDATLKSRVAGIMTLPGWLLYMMTGENVASHSFATGSGWMDLYTYEWIETAPKELLPKICKPEQSVMISPDCAKRLGIGVVPITIGAGDGGLNQIGAGAMKQGIMTFSVGTSGALRMATDSAVLPDDMSIWCYSLAEGKYIQGVATSGATNCVEWYRDLVGGIPHGELEASIPIELSQRMAAPTFLPFLFGERSPGWNAKRTGGFVGVNGSHTKGDLYYAVLEGILLNLYQCYKVLTTVCGVPNEIHISGGITKSEFWLSMAADMFGMMLYASTQQDASTMGAAALALKCAGAIQSLTEFPVNKGNQVMPNTAMREFYDARLQKYMEAYHDHQR